MFSKLKEKLMGDKRPVLDMDRESALEQLMKYDTQFLMDDSGSMAGSLWIEARDALVGIASVALKHDQDGIDIHFLNAANQGQSIHREADVTRLFELVKPWGGTPTGERLEQVLTAYIVRLEQAKAQNLSPVQAGIKPLNLIVITDGAPSDDPESVIVAAARRLDVGQFPLAQVGVQFIQIGNDEGARKALKRMDNKLSEKNGVRDIVDTRPFDGDKLTPEVLIAMLLGGINRRVDKIKKTER
ncbi:hypothetical protein RhiJN_00343 [Ceratobasidium sp. AG-Ba]|nr:hypothetical protein RhiJN_00343 [Ceratobasidium sp. AG-Ba]QRW01372.1 hypothetical protein RhiLY_00369 [Ceratobasidium sp. AG-Ba]